MKVHLSGAFLKFSAYRKEFSFQAGTVSQALDELVAECPELKSVIFDDEGAIRKIHRLFVNTVPLGQDAMHRELAPADELEIVTAVAGG